MQKDRPVSANGYFKAANEIEDTGKVLSDLWN
jgi:hypothetical protein